MGRPGGGVAWRRVKGNLVAKEKAMSWVVKLNGVELASVSMQHISEVAALRLASGLATNFETMLDGKGEITVTKQ